MKQDVHNHAVRAKILGGVPCAVRFTRKEWWAMWAAVCAAGQQNPFTSVLKSKLYMMLTDDERHEFNKRFSL